jgi:thioredoxin-dependent peroxiredoxin
MSTVNSEAKGKVKVGDLAPDFALPDTKGQQVRLSDFAGKKNVVVYFYPKDNTTGCTIEACAFRDSYEVFKDAGAEVIGISSDSGKSHEQFVQQHHLPFILLSDAGGAVRKSYGATAILGLIPGRITYVIDKQGVVRNVFSSLSPDGHVSGALKMLEELGK